jgi:hypothetical protein
MSSRSNPGKRPEITLARQTGQRWTLSDGGGVLEADADDFVRVRPMSQLVDVPSETAAALLDDQPDGDPLEKCPGYRTGDDSAALASVAVTVNEKMPDDRAVTLVVSHTGTGDETTVEIGDDGATELARRLLAAAAE